MNTVEATSAYRPLAPDLLVEVVSPNDFFSVVEAKVEQWLDSGQLFAPCRKVADNPPWPFRLQFRSRSDSAVPPCPIRRAPVARAAREKSVRQKV